MKKCIVQYWIQADQYSEPDYNKLLKKSDEFDADEFANRSARTFELYANKYNHDFVRITEKKLNYKHPTFERFDLWLDDHWWEKYDEIMYVDSDVFAMPDAPDIFAEYPDTNTLKVCEHTGFQKAETKEQIDYLYYGILKECLLEQVKQCGFQAGVFTITKEARDLMKPYIARYKELDDHDGNILLWATIKSGVPLTRMTELFNYKNAHFKGRPPVYFFHAAGHKKLTHHVGINSFLDKHGIK